MLNPWDIKDIIDKNFAMRQQAEQNKMNMFGQQMDLQKQQLNKSNLGPLLLSMLGSMGGAGSRGISEYSQPMEGSSLSYPSTGGVSGTQSMAAPSGDPLGGNISGILQSLGTMAKGGGNQWGIPSFQPTAMIKNKTKTNPWDEQDWYG